MIKILLDADASIKLSKISIIEKLANTFKIILTKEVYEEQVTIGLERGQPDAERIYQLVKSNKIEIKEVKAKIELISKNKKNFANPKNSKGIFRPIEPEAQSGSKIFVPNQKVILSDLGQKLGRGEKSVINYYLSKGADLICSDDEAFIRVLNAMNIPYSPSVGSILMLARRNKLTSVEGMEYLKRMKEMIKPEHFFYAKTIMEEIEWKT